MEPGFENTLIILTSVKAVADGAASFYIDHYVTARVAKASYGMKCNHVLDYSKEGHVKRISFSFTSPSGARRVPGAFQTILKKAGVLQNCSLGKGSEIYLL